ncbi:4-hydroxy-2-oxovalerate aldolase [Pseudodesulfovibrio hydrargyri]|uniref:4-hydroxy-2-oxovalerate aldolase n=1 Tax=Pseudodesulfovibrio hydrargyri TaxID=2125990 RepID=A0A1J5MVP9_9BACT|nr:hypothetical protein [Pseudodesulfovibrio hydrargyri]OIQ50058.1 4-hydroxy-2-oxovalerate aldolase [Pseudodesulfovibrio hydrargyri]
MEHADNNSVHLLECTLRDGSYAVDFQFTRSDTALLTGVLAGLGFKYIEIGHGLGLGAARGGKGLMPDTDADLIAAAAPASGDSLIGMFCIPGLATLDDLRLAADSGLDFVRVGENAPDSENAHQFLEQARKLGLKVAMNFMKSYAVSPEEFGVRARAAREHGAEIIYLVDSVGGMRSKDVAEYIDSAMAQAPGEMGFHGHDNLRLAVSNCLTAFEQGARYLDTTLYGLGRGAGNAPTEALAALFDLEGVDTGVDVVEVLEAAENHMWPLMSRFNVPDIMGTAMGYGQFHSSFFPKVREAAVRHDADPKRLVIAMGRIDPVHLDPDVLEREAAALAGTACGDRNQKLVSFGDDTFAGHRINTSAKAVRDLAEALHTTCAKRRNAIPVLEIRPAADPNSKILASEFVKEGPNYVLGRVVIDSVEAGAEVIEACRDKVSMFLFDISPRQGLGPMMRELSERSGHPVYPVDALAARDAFLVSAIESAGGDSVLLWGGDGSLAWKLDGHGIFQQMAWRGANIELPAGVAVIREASELALLAMRPSVVVCREAPGAEQAASMARVLATDGALMDACPAPSEALRDAAGDAYVRLDCRGAYDGLVSSVLGAAGQMSDWRKA